jgi:hypothetical protein
MTAIASALVSNASSAPLLEVESVHRQTADEGRGQHGCVGWLLSSLRCFVRRPGDHGVVVERTPISSAE